MFINWWLIKEITFYSQKNLGAKGKAGTPGIPGENGIPGLPGLIAWNLTQGEHTTLLCKWSQIFKFLKGSKKNFTKMILLI